MAWGWAPKSDLVRVDVLNTIGLSMMLMGVMCWIVLADFRSPGCARRDGRRRPSPHTPWAPHLPRTGGWLWSWPRRDRLADFAAEPAVVDDVAADMASVAAGVVRGWRAQSRSSAGRALPGFSVDGVRLCGAGRGIHPAELSGRVRRSGRAFFSMGLAGAVLIEFARWLDRQPRQFYAVQDYWHTSPSFFLIRVGMLLVILTASYAWCRWGRGAVGIQPADPVGPGVAAGLLGAH